MDKKVKGLIDLDMNIYYLCQDMLIYGIQALPFGSVGLELAINPRGNFVHYDFLKLHYIRHKI